MNFLSQQEKDEQLITFNETAFNFEVDQSIIELIAEQAKLNPTNTAIKGSQVEWTYSELDTITNQLAHCLRNNFGVTTSDLVGVKLDNSEWAIASLLAVLKAGAAYVPIDPNYPEARRQYILSTSTIKLLITDTNHLFDGEDFDGTLFAVDVEFDHTEYSTEPVELESNLDRPAYVIYTSGSTGNPKGVVVSHKSLANYLIWTRCEYAKNELALNFGFFSSLSFDLTITSLYLPLITGGYVQVFDQNRDTTSLLTEYMMSELNAIKLTPAHASILGIIKQNAPHLKVVIVGGDALTTQHIQILQELASNARIYNEYGPTEATVGCIVKEIQTDKEANSIGKPITNTQVYLLSARNDLQPLGVTGEICIGGEGLALEYLNNAEQTAEKFINHPFSSGKRLYKTGDLGKWQSDGNILFVGRKDDQVKIKGYRVELGEVEQCLVKNEKVESAVAAAPTNEQTGEKELVVYFTAQSVLNRRELVDFLQSILPEYMIPSRFVQLEELPLNANGKVDRKALPNAFNSELSTGTVYVEPSTEYEKKLVLVCEDVLNHEKISIKDNFYHLGGDSIKSIQVVARLKQHGLSLKVEHILKHPVLEDLATFVRVQEHRVEQDDVSGEVPLSPIQKWFFYSPQVVEHNYFNQSVQLKSLIELDTEALKSTVEQLTRHHDALRMIFKKTNNDWQQINRDATEPTFEFSFHDLRESNQPEQELEGITEHLQSHMSLENGQLVKAAHFRLKGEDIVLLIIHHLVVDGVSWRIILDDLETIYRAISSGEKPTLPEKTDAFKRWSEQLREYALSDQLHIEKSYWRAVAEQTTDDLPMDISIDQVAVNDTERKVHLNADRTKVLMSGIHERYGTDVNDLLISSLGLALKETLGCGRTVVEMEGHGRETIVDGLDVTRTVGWFTSMYPFILDTSKHEVATDVLIDVKDDLRRLPRKGIGYGVLNYLSDEQHNVTITPQVRFNYLGDFGSTVPENSEGLFTFGDKQIAPDSAIENGSKVPLDITCIVVNGELTISIRYSTERFNDAVIDRFAGSYLNNMHLLMDELSASNERVSTPSDFTFKGLALDELRTLNSDQQLEDVYELSPLQKGIYFHWLTNASTSLYLEQTSYRIKAENLSIEQLKQAYDQLVERHAILRTCFTNNYAGRLLQVVKKKVKSNFSVSSITDANLLEERVETAKQEDLKKGFDLETGSQMRLHIIELGNNRYEFIWSHHHILMDGWCISLLVNDFNQLLQHQQGEHSIDFPEVIPYANYIEWLDRQNDENGLSYWKGYLENYEEIASVPFSGNSNSERFVGNEISVDVTGELFQNVHKLCLELGITHNSFVRAVWGYLLARYNNTNDVVFGAVVSGRPAELVGVEGIIGLFSNTVPVRLRTESEKSARELLTKIQAESIEGAAFHFLSLADIQSQLENGTNWINHVMLFQNYALKELDDGFLNGNEDGGFEVESVSSNVESNYDFNVVVSPQEDSFKISFKYNANAFEEADVKRIAGHFSTLVEEFVTKVDAPLRTVNYLTKEEINHVLELSGNPTPSLQSFANFKENELTLVHGFKKMVERHPQKTALIAHNKSFTYLQLDQFSNLLALELKQRYNVSSEDRIGIQLNRNEWMIVAMLGVLKAGGAYVPIDPSYPASRKEYMIQDSGLTALITEADFIYDIDYFDGDVFAIDVELDTSNADESVQFSTIIRPEQLAYVMYTSGSTGNPKGVMVEHRSILNTILAQIDHFDLDSSDIGLQFASFSFDASISEIGIMLLSGGTVCLADEKERKDPEILINLIQTNKVSIATLPPTYMKNIEVERISSLKKLISAGEAADPRKANEFVQNGTYFNAYGPTETAICATIYTLEEHLEDLPNSLPIGKPIANTSVFLLSSDHQLSAKGLIGEICIGGKGVARGYLNNSELSAEKFIENPFANDGQLYKTGDLGRWLPDGNLEFVGRKDDQVKINGYRVELGEVESAILKNDRVKETVVLAKNTEGTNTELVAYYVASNEVKEEELKADVARRLPSYMVPSRFMAVASFPLTPNGKIDRKALPDPSDFHTAAGVEFIAAQTEEEIVLVKVWEDVLKRDKIGVQDSFYSLGGDSIKSIQVAARLKQKGYTLKVESILKTPTIRELSTIMQKTQSEYVQQSVSGRVALTPIQQWFFSSEDVVNHHHFNQSLLLKTTKRIDETIVTKCLEALVSHHDALRMQYRWENGEWVQENKAATQGCFKTHVYDLTEAENPELELKEIGEQLQGQLNLENGPLMQVAHVKLKESDRLGLIVHHLVMDGVSWRILMEDFMYLYDAYSNGRVPKLPLKTSSYQEWASALVTYAKSTSLLEEQSYWKSVVESTSKTNLFLNREDIKVDTPTNAAETFQLDVEDTELLKSSVHDAFQTEMNDILLAAFSAAVTDIFGDNQVSFNLEGHGREELFEEIDVTRTIGWFTAVYPVRLEIDRSSLVNQLINVKETLRKIPNKGIGFGILKYLSNAPFDAEISPRITFNYLGEFSGNNQSDEQFDFAPESFGNDVSVDNKNSSWLDISGRIENQVLMISLRYANDRLEQESVKGLAEAFRANLILLIDSLKGLKSRVLTPSDLTFTQLAQDEINAVNERGTLVDAYELSPLQKGIFFHWLADQSSGMYVEQTCYRIHAQHLNIREVEGAYLDLIHRYDILRTSFSQSYGGTLLQFVHKEVSSGFVFHEILEPDAYEQLHELKQQDIQKGFDLSEGSQMRLTLVKLSESEYEFIWSHHHILMDGWCISLLVNDFNALLTARLNGVQANLPAVKPYGDYIKWLLKVDQAESSAYWKAYLSDTPSIAEVPFNKGEKGLTYAEGKSRIQIADDLFQQANALCAQLAITQNTFIQAVWGYLLSRYNACTDVVFGAVVSGRPAALEGVEQMVGLFINTIPVRVQYKANDTVKSLLLRIQTNAIESSAFHYQNLTEVLAEGERGSDLINHILLFENYAIQSADESTTELMIQSVETYERTNYDFNLIISPGTSNLDITAVFNQAKFDPRDIDRLMMHFQQMIAEFTSRSEAPLSELNFLSKEERDTLLINFNQTTYPYQTDKTVVDLIEAQTQKTPKKTAICFESNSLTYAELSEISNQLGHYLLENYAVEPDNSIAIQLPRNEWMLIAMLGVLKSGAAYVPINEDQPDVRLTHILKESNSKLLLDKSELEKFVSSKANYSITLPQISTRPNHLAYTIFTSGSSGLPKGVLIEHRNVTNFFEGMTNVLGGEAGVFLAMTNFTFDISVLELLWTLSLGYKVVLQKEAKQLDPNDPYSVGEQVKRHGVTHIQMTPSLGTILDQQLSNDDEWSSLKTILFGGEQLPLQLVESIFKKLPHVDLYNMYGPTETTIWSTVKRLEKNTTQIEIGSPIANTQIYILDEQLKPSPIGVAGEMYIGGKGVARGYTHEELTALHFIDNPFRSGERMYRTGDFGTWLSTGSIHCFGRKDQQIKIRGYRIELGEIEEALRNQDEIIEAAVLLHQNEREKRLIAFVTSNEELRAGELRTKLKTVLPEYMLPNQFVQLTEIPLNTSGKIDRKALSEMESVSLSTGAAYIAPANELEMELVQIWKEVLKVDKIGTHDDFFVLGGHSLKAMQLIVRIEEQFGVRTDLRNFLENPTIVKSAEDLGALIWIKEGEDTSETEGDELII